MRRYESDVGGAPATAEAAETVQREVRKQNRAIDALFREASRLLRKADPESDALARLEQTLDAHFDREDRLYFPPILALRPEHRPRLEACTASHDWFRARLQEIREQLRSDALAEAVRGLERLAAAFAEHEAREEEVLACLERELGVRP